MPVGSLTEALDNLYTTTWQNMKAGIVDQIFDATPFWFWLKQNNGLEAVEGGRFLTEPLQYAKSERVQFIGKGGSMSLSDQEFLTEAVDDWKYLADSIVRFGVDDQKNRGKNRIINLMNSKLENSKTSLEDKVETVLFDNSSLTTQQQALAFTDLRTIVADTPTNSVHGISGNTNTWWKNQTQSMSGISFAVYGQARMRTLLNDCRNNKASDSPDIIVSGQTPYEYYEESVQEQKRIVNQKLGDAGFENIEFKGIPMVWSPSCSDARMYFLNTRFLKFKYDTSMFFDMTEWKAIPDQVNDRVAQIITAGNLMTSRRRVHGVLHTINTQ